MKLIGLLFLHTNPQTIVPIAAPIRASSIGVIYMLCLTRFNRRNAEGQRAPRSIPTPITEHLTPYQGRIRLRHNGIRQQLKYLRAMDGVSAMQTGEQISGECNLNCACVTDRPGFARRDFLKAAGLTPLVLITSKMPVMAGPFESNREFSGDDKKLSPAWIASLTDRGKPTVYTGAELEKIGMPIGGIGAGQIYLGGDGKLWHWDIFNIPHGTGDGGYAHPRLPDSPLEQGFAIRVTAGSNTSTHTLDRAGFNSIGFSGQYPIGTVTYEDTDCPVTVSLEAFSPFIPLNADDSSLPATILNYTVRNAGKDTVDVSIIGWLQNAVTQFSNPVSGKRRNRIVAEKGLTLLECSAGPSTEPAAALRPNRLVEDWSHDTYTGWTVEGTAFGAGPIKRTMMPGYQGDVGGDTDRVVNSHATAPGGDVAEKDKATGKLTSSPFILDRSFLNFWIGGGAHENKTCLNLTVDGKTVRTATGRDSNQMTLQSFDVRQWANKTAILQIVDDESGPWGNIGVGRITLSDVPLSTARLEDLPDYGEIVLGLLGSPAQYSAPVSEKRDFEAPHAGEAVRPIGETLIGSLGRRMKLEPGAAKSVTFLLAWRFPNLKIDGLGAVGRHYAVRFNSAAAVAAHITRNFDRLARDTRLWRDTWYNSTLPYWFLDRTLLTISTLATGACYRFANGRFYAWEGVGCCAGTCTHVWHYAHAMARLFPELERDTRERVDFGIAYHADSGVIGFRAEFDNSLAVDGQAGTLLRAYREHLMSADDAFLKRNWPHIKSAFQPLFRLDGNSNGVLEGGQMNTLDQPWYGKISWLSSLYVAALRAGEAMAGEMHEPEFAARCRTVADRGSRNIDAQLFNGEYYIQTRDESKGKSVGSYDGCEVDQVFGAGWAGQVGLAGVLPRPHVLSALKSLWKYSFLVDVGPFRESHKPGRWYAMAGEAGLLMCSWPRGESARESGGFDFYLNECMTGFEYQAAGHMVREGLVTEGLAVTRAIHDRYHASKRNPWNEVECGDHYSRAMAGLGVYLSMLGFDYHGPQGRLTFAPRISPGNFMAAFTCAQGWGTFTINSTQKGARTSIDLKWGLLKLHTLTIPIKDDVIPKKLSVTLDGHIVSADHALSVREGDPNGYRALTILFPEPETVIHAGQRLELKIT